MTYTLVVEMDAEDVTGSRLENPDGEIIAEYDDVPPHPNGTAEDTSADFSNNPQNMFLFILQRRWDSRIEQS